MPAALTATYEKDSVPNLPAAEDGNDTICDWVSNQTSEQLYSLNGFTHSVKPQDDYESYMYDAVQDLHNDNILNDNDHIILVDALALDGYGRIYPNGSINLDGNEYYGPCLDASVQRCAPSIARSMFRTADFMTSSRN